MVLHPAKDRGGLPNSIFMKKKAALNKKLLLGKNIIASLSKDQQQKLAGGVIITVGDRCYTRAETCATIRYTERFCRPCDS